MIDNIWHLRGSTKLPPDTTDDAIIERLKTFLAKQHKPVVDQQDSAIGFSSPLWRDWMTPNWLALVLYDEGRFWIERGLEGRCLRYDLQSLQGLAFCLIAASIFFAFVSFLEGVATGARIALLAFAWLYGANIVLAWVRVPLAIKRAVNVR